MRDIALETTESEKGFELCHERNVITNSRSNPNLGDLCSSTPLLEGTTPHKLLQTKDIPFYYPSGKLRVKKIVHLVEHN